MQSDRVDKSAVKSYEEQSERIGTNYKPTKPDSKLIIMARIAIGQITNAVFFTVPAKNAANLRARFENIAKNNDDASRQRVEEERRQRQLKDKQDKEQTEKLEAQRYILINSIKSVLYTWLIQIFQPGPRGRTLRNL